MQNNSLWLLVLQAVLLTIRYCCVMSKNLEGFVIRLNEILDDKGIPQWGRQRFMSNQFKVSQPSAKKWMDGLNYPEMSKLIEIARWGNTSVDWLVSGNGLKNPPDKNLDQNIIEIVNLLQSTTDENRLIAKNVLIALLKKNL